MSKIYLVLEEDIEGLLKTFENEENSWWLESRVAEWQEKLEFIKTSEDKENSKYKSLEDSPKELNINTYWKCGNVSYLREGLPYDHEENLYNWFTKTYPELNPELYNIEKPRRR